MTTTGPDVLHDLGIVAITSSDAQARADIQVSAVGPQSRGRGAAAPRAGADQGKTAGEDERTGK